MRARDHLSATSTTSSQISPQTYKLGMPDPNIRMIHMPSMMSDTLISAQSGSAIPGKQLMEICGSRSRVNVHNSGWRRDANALGAWVSNKPFSVQQPSDKHSKCTTSGLLPHLASKTNAMPIQAAFHDD